MLSESVFVNMNDFKNIRYQNIEKIIVSSIFTQFYEEFFFYIFVTH